MSLQRHHKPPVMWAAAACGRCGTWSWGYFAVNAHIGQARLLTSSAFASLCEACVQYPSLPLIANECTLLFACPRFFVAPFFLICRIEKCIYFFHITKYVTKHRLRRQASCEARWEKESSILVFPLLSRRIAGPRALFHFRSSFGQIFLKQHPPQRVGSAMLSLRPQPLG